MNTPNQENLILAMLQANLTNEKLILGLTDLRIDPSLYSVDLAYSVLSLIGFDDPKQEFVFEYYQNLMARSRNVTLAGNINELKIMSQEVYEELLRFKAYHDQLSGSANT